MKFKAGDKVFYRTTEKNGKVVLCIDPEAPPETRLYYVEIKKQIWVCPEKKLLKIT